MRRHRPRASESSRAMAKREKKRARGVLDLPKAVEDRLAEGRAERESVPLEAHAEWVAPADRPDPVGILEAQDATRVPELVPIRHGRMIVSPFTFYRGSAAIMAEICRAPRAQGCACSAAATRTCRTSACSPLPTARSCSTSTTSTRRCRRRSSGTSSAWWPASSSPLAATAIVARNSRRGPRHRHRLSHDDGQGDPHALPGRLVHALRSRQVIAELAATVTRLR